MNIFLFFILILIPMFLILSATVGGRRVGAMPIILATILMVGMLYMLDFPPFGSIDNFALMFEYEEEYVPVKKEYIPNTSADMILNDSEVLDTIQPNDYMFNKSTVLEYDTLLDDDYDLEDV